MKETFFDPLGMKNTWVRDVHNEKESETCYQLQRCMEIQAENPMW